MNAGRERALSTGAVAKMLSVSRSAVTLWCEQNEADPREGLAHSRTPGGHFRVTPTQVDEFVRRKTAATYRADADERAA